MRHWMATGNIPERTTAICAINICENEINFGKKVTMDRQHAKENYRRFRIAYFWILRTVPCVNKVCCNFVQYAQRKYIFALYSHLYRCFLPSPSSSRCFLVSHGLHCIGGRKIKHWWHNNNRKIQYKYQSKISSIKEVSKCVHRYLHSTLHLQPVKRTVYILRCREINLKLKRNNRKWWKQHWRCSLLLPSSVDQRCVWIPNIFRFLSSILLPNKSDTIFNDFSTKIALLVIIICVQCRQLIYPTFGPVFSSGFFSPGVFSPEEFGFGDILGKIRQVSQIVDNNDSTYVRESINGDSLIIDTKHSDYTSSRTFNDEKPVKIYNTGTKLYKIEPNDPETVTMISPKEGTTNTYDLTTETTDRSFNLKIDSNMSGRFILHNN